MANGRLNLTEGQTQPLFTPALYGLLDTASELPQLPPHWQQGLTWEPLCPDSFATWSECLVRLAESDVPVRPADTEPDPTLPTPKDESTFHRIHGALPFTAVAEVHCSPTAGPEQIRRMASQALIRSEQRQVESVFWTGDAAGQQVVWPHLASDIDLVEPEAGGAVLQETATVVAANALPAKIALAQLETALGACYDGIGTIHMPYGLLNYFAAEDLITTQAGLARTKLGNKIVAGRGYPGTGPSGGTDPDVNWIFATGSVFYKRGEIFQPDTVQSLDRQRNTVKAQAERTYVIGWDCCLLAIQVDLETMS